MAKGKLLSNLAAKNSVDTIVGNAAKWAMIGGVGMGTVEKVRGGSFVEGAARGALMGGIGGGLYGAYGRNAKSLDSLVKGKKGADAARAAMAGKGNTINAYDLASRGPSSIFQNTHRPV